MSRDFNSHWLVIESWIVCRHLPDYIVATTISSLLVCSTRVLCVHGGLSPEIRTLDQVNVINRLQEIPHEGSFCDMMWSDPEDIPDAWRISPRGAGYLFGGRVTDEFTRLNGLDLICRAHQLVMEGWKYHFKNQNLVTVWSAPNYCYRCGNAASVLAFDDHLARDHKLFNCVDEADFGVEQRNQVVPYFL